MEIEEHKTRHFRVRCTAPWEAPECAGEGPAGLSRREAKDLALEAGWHFEQGKMFETHAVCPHHWKAKYPDKEAK